MEALEAQFKNKIDITKECLEFCRGDPQATLAETNMAAIEIGELKRKMQILKTVVDKLNLQTKQAKKISEYMHERIETCEHLSENLPTRIGSTNTNSNQVKIEAGNQGQVGKKKQTTTNSNPVTKKPSNMVPKIRFLSLDEFASIPKYMKGRLGYDNVNTSIQEFNAALEARYAFLAKGFQAMASMALKKRYKEMKSNETRDTRGFFFVVADDLKNSETLKSEASRRVIFTILRHFQLIREIRGPLSLVRYAAVV